MNRQGFIKELMRMFSKETGCSIQFNDCPCNTCFHAIDADFQHITWLILLALRGDHKESYKGLLDQIKKEL